MKDNLHDIPLEVLEVGLYKSLNRPVDSETFKRLQATINKYPEYFPWEHKYNSIPKEVHDAYSKEEVELYYSHYPRSAGDLKEGEGLVAYINRVQEENKNKPSKYLKEVIEEISAKENKYKKLKKQLWEKYYGKYKLKYNER